MQQMQMKQRNQMMNQKKNEIFWEVMVDVLVENVYFVVAFAFASLEDFVYGDLENVVLLETVSENDFALSDDFLVEVVIDCDVETCVVLVEVIDFYEMEIYYA